MTEHHALTDEERAIYEWQLWVEGFGEDPAVQEEVARRLGL